MITNKRIQSIFGVAREQVEQVGSKQLFIVKLEGYSLLVSYTTIIGINLRGGVWQLTKEKYSVTTSKQTSQFMSSYGGVRVEPEELAQLLDSVKHVVNRL